MFAFLQILLLCVHLLHFKSTQALHDNVTTTTINTTLVTTTTAPHAALALEVVAEAATAAAAKPINVDTITIESQLPDQLNASQLEAEQAEVLQSDATQAFEVTLTGTNSTHSAPAANNSRTGRQLYFEAAQPYLPHNYAWEGASCLTARGLNGVCVRIDNCRQYYRVGRQLTLISVSQWAAQPAHDICTYYDQLGRANSGICCSSIASSGIGVAACKPQTELKPATQNTEATSRPTTVADDFQDNNDIDADKPAPPTASAAMPVMPVTYADGMRYQYQRPPTFGHFAGLPQWPPPIPTHPPSTGGWPPPIPTHPPNHHYPTHPTPAAAARPTAHTTRRTTTARPVTTTTTTRRPSYPAYPGYPIYPAHRPTAAPIATTTTTRRPAATGGSTPEGLPLQCGIRNPVTPDQQRIVGGTSASPHEFPWIAVLFRSGKQFCGGSLITHSHILTAAHCVARMTSWDVAALTANLGDHDIRSDFEVAHVQRRIKRLVRHKGFEFSTLHNDIAILTLSEPVQYTSKIQPICLPTSTAQQSRSYSGQLATVAGWGSLHENGPQPSILQKVDIPIWNNGECARKYGRAAPGGIIESMICAGQAAKDSCSGDSGGPMIVQDGGRYTQVGIVSWGIGCGKGQYPGVYTRVTSLLPWIYKNIK